MSMWDLIRRSARRKGMEEDEEEEYVVPSLRESFISPFLEEKRNFRKTVKHVTELAELATYISTGCQMGLSVKEIRKALNTFTKRFENLCNLLNIKIPFAALTQLEIAYDNWSRNPNNQIAQYNLVDAVSRILDILKTL